LDDDSDDNLVKGNTANNNGGNGIEIDGDSNTVTNNNANSNGDAGIAIDGGLNTTVSHNTTNDNDEFGIDDDDLTLSNTFDKNKCRKNGIGGSDPAGLCAPQG